MPADSHDDECRAVWYFGDGDDGAKHVCHRGRKHRGGHHSDGGLSWAKDPHHRRVRLDDSRPCDDCEPARGTVR